jgi:hypothetical protein
MLSSYSRLCLNPYLSVDTKKYGILQSMGFGRAHPRAIFWVIYVLYYVLNDYILSKYNNYEVKWDVIKVGKVEAVPLNYTR